MIKKQIKIIKIKTKVNIKSNSKGWNWKINSLRTKFDIINK